MECFMCKNRAIKRDGKLKAFTAVILQKCKTFLQTRKILNFKYSDVTLPQNLDETALGYHSQCYKEFLLHKKYISAVTDDVQSILHGSRYVNVFAPPFTSRPVTSTLEHLQSEPTPGSSRMSPKLVTSTPNPIPRHTYNPTKKDDSSNDSDIFTDNLDEANVNVDVNQSVVNDWDLCDSSVLNSTNQCFFCEKNRMKRKGQWLSCRVVKHANKFLLRIRTLATKLNDSKILTKIELSMKLSDDVAYHNVCLKRYETAYVKHDNSSRSAWHDVRDFNKIAVEKLCVYINDEVLLQSRIVSLQYLKTFYVQILNELYHKQECQNIFCTRWLPQKLLSYFKEQIEITKIGKVDFVVSSQFDVKKVDNELVEKIIFEEEAKLFALKYRKHLLDIEKEPLPDCLNEEALIKGECIVPKWLKQFWTTVLGGVSTSALQSPRTQRLASSFSQDSIFAVSHGKINTPKHIHMGIVMKSMTGSRKAINILNRQGHCISYTAIEELETSAAYTATTTKLICPSGIDRSPNLLTGVAWDNFDRFVDTSSGKDTLHDTVGIVYQDVPREGAVITTINDESNDVGVVCLDKSRKRIRMFEPIGADFPRDAKKYKMSCNFIPKDDESRSQIPENLAIFKNINLAWILSHALNISNTPMWVGFNAKILQDKSHMQKIEYLTQINESPTDINVVKETMRRSVTLADECGRTYMQVTYDLAIAKIAFQIQSAEKEEFQRLFIHLGPFHIMMAYFKAVGKFINGCGITNMLVDTGILAQGSVNGFLSGTHFNRCRKYHPLISAAIQILHFEYFFNSRNITEVDNNIKDYLTEFQQHKSESPVIENEALEELLTDYKTFVQATLNGEHGKTPQFYIMYVQLIDHYLCLETSIRQGNFELFKYILPKITNLFFAFNQPNYSRYLVLYHNNLLNVETTHPGLINEFQHGGIGIKRTSKSFSRSPIDLTLEQTINADAARRTSGVINLTNSFSARQKWAVTHSLRTALSSYLLEICDLKTTEDITDDLKASVIKKHSKDIRNFIDNVKECTNPFSNTLHNDHLYNISSGQSVAESVYMFLSSVEVVGDEQRQKFILNCNNDENNFQKRITRNKIINFESTNKKKVKVSGKIEEVKIQRDIFGRLLYASQKNEINIEKALCYPLTAIPFSLCHLDGTICKTPKSVLLNELEIHQNCPDRPVPYINIIDGFFFLHQIKQVPTIYRNIAIKIFQDITSVGKEIHLIFDKFNSPSIKDYEHSIREENDTQYNITSKGKRSDDFSKQLRSRHFKDNFIHFLLNDWTDHEFVKICEGKTVKVSFDKCYVFKVVDGEMCRTIDMDLTCMHEEADTKIIFHICQLLVDVNVQIRCSDSDILIIMLGNMRHLKSHPSIYMHIGTGNNQRYINVNELYANLGEMICSALPAFHAFTGCDFNPSFFRKGKKRPLTLLKDSNDFQETFASLGNASPNLIQETDKLFKKLEEFVCRMYSLKTKNSVNAGRFELFLKSYKIKNVTEKILKKSLTRYDASNLPPCERELRQHILRSLYIASIWNNSHLKIPTLLDPKDCGWVEIEHRYEFYWFEGDQHPSIQEIITNFESDSETGDEDEDVLSTDSSEDTDIEC